VATVKQISEFREKYAIHGGHVLATAGRINDTDGEAVLVNVGKVAWTGLGWIAWILGMSN
jgi:hypothetical protein